MTRGFVPTNYPWLPEIPNGWDAMPLKRFSRRYSGGTPDRNRDDYWENGEIPWINSGAVNQVVIAEPSKYITELGFKNSSAKWVSKGSLVMALAGQGKTKGMVAQMGIDATCNQSMAAIDIQDSDPRFMFWWLSSQYLNIRNLSSGDGRDGLNLEMLGDIPCPVPPPIEQKAISKYLDRETARIDSLIEKKQRLLELLAERRTAVITHATTKGLDPRAPMKDSGLDWLGQIPAHWEVTQARFALGRGVYGISDSTSQDGEYGVLRMGDIGYGNVSTTNLARIEFVDSHLIVEPGDLLFNRTNSYEQVAKVGLFFGDPKQKISFASYLVRFRPIANARYLSFLLNLPTYLDFVRSHSFRAIGQVNLNPSRYAQLKICVPPATEQKEIADHLSAADQRFAFVTGKIRDAVERLVEYRSVLITNAVTGKIDCRNLESKKEAAA